MRNWREIGREIGIVILFAFLLVLASFGMSLYTVWRYHEEIGALRVEKALLMAVITYQILLGAFLYWKLSSLVVRGLEYVVFYSAPILLYAVFNQLEEWVFFGVLLAIAITTVYRIRRLTKTAHDFRKVERWEHGRDHTLPV